MKIKIKKITIGELTGIKRLQEQKFFSWF